MEDLIQKNKYSELTLIKVPKEFANDFDKWIQEKSEKNNTKISKTMGFNMIRQVLPDIDININIIPKETNKRLLINMRGKR